MYPGISLIRLKTSDEGFIRKDELEALLCEYNKDLKHGKKRIRIVAVSGASNVLGVFNDLEEISHIVHKYGAHLLVDAAQLVAHRKVEIEKCEIDYFAFSAHKVYAPFGTGVLVARKGLLNFNKEKSDRIRSSGEENAAGIAAMGKAFLLLQRIGFDLIREEEQELTKRALLGLSQIEGVQLYGITDPDSPQFSKKGGVIVFALNKSFSNTVANNLALRGGIGTRYGCHCAHILIKHLVGVGPFLERLQHLMARMFPVGFPGLARISLGIGNTEADIDNFLKVLRDIAMYPKVNTGSAKRKMEEFVKKVAERVYSGYPEI
jgi:selenocysteine lyase/cysteine desulfurase